MSSLVYLLTGGCGFLGRHLLTVLLEKEDALAEIRVFDRAVEPGLKALGTGEALAPRRRTTAGPRRGLVPSSCLGVNLNCS